MAEPRFHPAQITLIAIVATGAFILAMTGDVAAMRPPFQKSCGDYDSHHQSHCAGWWSQNRQQVVTVYHREWTEVHAQPGGQMGDSERLHAWHYGDGSFDRNSSGPTTDELTNKAPLLHGRTEAQKFVTRIQQLAAYENSQFFRVVGSARFSS